MLAWDVGNASTSLTHSAAGLAFLVVIKGQKDDYQMAVLLDKEEEGMSLLDKIEGCFLFFSG